MMKTRGEKIETVVVLLIFLLFIISSVANIVLAITESSRTITKIAPCGSKHVNESYELKYRIIYEDLSFTDKWVKVDRAEYDSYEKLKNSGG